MKTFKEYLAEGKKSYSFKIKVAGDLPEDFQSNLKTSLERCKVMKMEKISTTPIQAVPMDFPTMKNCEVHVFEVACEYPITSPEIISDVRALGLDETCFRVRGSNESSEIDQVETLNADGLLTDSQYKEATNVKHKDFFGDDFNKSFLKDLSKVAKQQKKDSGQSEYKLPKAKTDKTGVKSALGS
jgi:hypothetical protein